MEGSQPRSIVKKRKVVKKAFYSDEEDETVEEEIPIEIKPEISTFGGPNPSLQTNSTNLEGDSELDPDHRLILKSSLPLLKSRNSGVVLGVCTLHYYCGTQSEAVMKQVGKSLVRISRNQREVQYVVLHAINIMARDRPEMFRPFLSDFFVKATDSIFNRLLKLEILTSLSCKENIKRILRELEIYLKDPNVEFVCTTVTAVGRVVDTDRTQADNCMEGIMQLLILTNEPLIIKECCTVLRCLLQQQNMESKTSAKILKQLVKLLIMENGIREPSARASITWLVGEYQQLLSKVAPDIVRVLAKGFADEATETKMQILNLTIKVSLQNPENDRLQILMTYVLEMARYDLDTDLRDRARFFTALLGLAPTNENGEGADMIVYDEASLAVLASYAKNIMTAPKLPPVTLFGSVDVAGMDSFALGSLSSMVGHQATGYVEIPSWPEVQPDPTVREPVKFTNSQDENDTGKYEDRPARPRHSDSSSEDDFKIFEDKTKENNGVPADLRSAGSDEDDEDEEDDDDDEDGSEYDDDDDDDDEEEGDDDDEEGDGDDSSEESDRGKAKQKRKNEAPSQEPSKSTQKKQPKEEESDSEDDLLSSLGKSSSKSSMANNKPQTKTAFASSIRRVAPAAVSVKQQHQALSLIAMEDDFGLLTMNPKPSSNNVAPQQPPQLQQPAPPTTNHLAAKQHNSKNTGNLLMDFGYYDLLNDSSPGIQPSPQATPHSYGNMNMKMSNGDLLLSSMAAPLPAQQQQQQQQSSIYNNNTLPTTNNPQYPSHDHSNLLSSPTNLASSANPLPQVTNSQDSVDLLMLSPAPAISNALVPSNGGFPSLSTLPVAPQNQDLLSLDFSSFSVPSTMPALSPLPPASSSSGSLPSNMNMMSVPNVPAPAQTQPQLTQAFPSPAFFPGQPQQSHPQQQPHGPMPPALPGTPLLERPAEEFTEPRPILNPGMGGGLTVSIAFRKGVSSVTYSGATCLFVIIRNIKSIPIK